MSLPRTALGRLVDTFDNPILIVELRAAFRRRRYVYLLTFMLALVALLVLVTVSALSTGGDPSEAGRRAFLAFYSAELVLVLIVFPAFSCTAIVEERLNKSFDLLVTTRLRAARIIFGKLLGAVVYGSTFVVATAPLVAIAFLFGGVTPTQIVLAYLSLLLVGLVVSVYGIMVSAVAKSAAGAVVRTFVLLPFVVLCVLGPLAGLVFASVFGPLFSDSIYGAARPGLQGSAFETAFLWAVALGWVATWVSLFFLVAANRIKPPLADRTTAPRAWFVIFWSGWLAAACVAFHMAGPTQISIRCAYFLTLALTVFATGACAFAVDDGVTPRRLETFSGRRWFFGATAKRGAAFVLLIAAASFGVIALAVDALPPSASLGSFEEPSTILAWGGAWTLCFLLALTQAGVLLSRVAGSVSLVRVWLALGVAVIGLFPMLWFHLDLRSDRGDVYKGYALSPYTVMWSICEKPHRLSRQLILFGPSGLEIVQAQEELAEAYEGEELERRRTERRESMLAEGIQVKTGSTIFYLLAGLTLLGVNRRKSD